MFFFCMDMEVEVAVIHRVETDSRRSNHSANAWRPESLGDSLTDAS